MQSSIVRQSIRAGACAAALALAVPAAGVFAARHTGHHATAPRWLVVNAKSHTATLTLIAAYNNNLGGFNFNGYGNGKMVITVPLKYRVNVVFQNKGAVPHSALFTPYSARNKTINYPIAFRGASSPNPSQGTTKGKTVKFSFIVNKTGTYALVCAVPGHEVAGMWDTLTVTSGGKASLSFH